MHAIHASRVLQRASTTVDTKKSANLKSCILYLICVQARTLPVTVLRLSSCIRAFKTCEFRGAGDGDNRYSGFIERIWIEYGRSVDYSVDLNLSWDHRYLAGSTWTWTVE
jgi:hypothetical protein